jgi:hypothetical protein|tara:strand:+ start:221 stop:583 length:363 start_codon:yes stop_codon:yes gene_type:complete
MTDIFDNKILCNGCDKETNKHELIKDGFIIRIAKCENCNKEWHHPSDVEKYNNFKKIRDKTFNVKLRMVGNSYTISIPREIIKFEEEFQKKINQMLNISLEEPEKISIYFSKRIKQFLRE